MVFAYVGPETLFPVLSALAGFAGVVLMLGRRALNPFIRLYRFARRNGCDSD